MRAINFSLLNKFIIYAGVSFVLIVLLSLYVFFRQQNEYNNITVIRLTSEISLAHKTIDDTIKYSEALLKTISASINENPNNQEHIKNTLRIFGKTYSKKFDDILSITMFSWVGQDKKLRVNSEFGILKKPVDVSTRDYLPHTINQPNRLFLGAPVDGSVSHQYIIPAGIGIKDRAGKYRGSIVFGFNISGVYKKISQINKIPNSFFKIIYKNKVIYGSSKKNESITEIDPDLNDLQIFQNLSIIKENSISVYKKIDNTDYGLLLTIYNDKYTKIFNTSYFVEIFLLILFFIFLLYLLKKDFINPVLQLSDTAKLISSGKTDIKISYSNIKEINQLANSILSIKDFIVEQERSKIQVELAKQIADKANISKISMMRSITHDIKNYIFGICGLSKLIIDKKDQSDITDSEDLQTVEIIYTQSEELMHFVEDLLDINQIENSDLKLHHLEYCDVQDLINRMLMLHRGMAIEHHVLLKAEIENDLPKISCDIRRIKQIMTNLLTNAIKYSKIDTIIKISAKHLKKTKQICIEICDQGIGMTEEEIELILAGRGYEISKDKIYDSYGIGMTTVLQLIKLHNADIKIESKKNIGTTIKLFFNISNEERFATNQDHKKLKNNKTILLVDDNPVNIKISSTILRNAGYKTYYAENGKEAVSLLDKLSIDMILMDGEMPLMNGYETTKIIRDGKIFRNFKNYKKIPILALMSSSDAATIKKAIGSGMNDHLEKSTSKNKLLKIIDNYL